MIKKNKKKKTKHGSSDIVLSLNTNAFTYMVNQQGALDITETAH